MTPLLYSIAFLGCSSAPEPIIAEELSPFEAETWTLEQITKDIQESYENEDWKRLGTVLFFMKPENFHALEPMLFQFYSESPPTSQEFQEYSAENPRKTSYRIELRLALQTHAERLRVAHFMSHQGLTHKNCAQTLDKRRKNIDYSKQNISTFSDKEITCLIVFTHMRRCINGYHEDGPVKSAHILDVPGCRPLRAVFEEDFSHWDEGLPVLHPYEPTP